MCCSRLPRACSRGRATRRTCRCRDANHDGVSELAVTDATNALRLVSGEWLLPRAVVGAGLAVLRGSGDTDGDPADEYMLRRVSTGSTSLVDGMTGAPRDRGAGLGTRRTAWPTLQ